MLSRRKEWATSSGEASVVDSKNDRATYIYQYTLVIMRQKDRRPKNCGARMRNAPGRNRGRLGIDRSKQSVALHAGWSDESCSRESIRNLRDTGGGE